MDDPYKTYYSEKALWIDKCKPSEGGGQITLRTWKLSDSVNKSMGTILGGTSKDSAGCWKFANWTQWAPYIIQSGVQWLEDSGLVPP